MSLQDQGHARSPGEQPEAGQHVDGGQVTGHSVEVAHDPADAPLAQACPQGRSGVRDGIVRERCEQPQLDLRTHAAS